MVPSENFLRYSLCSAVIRRTARARSYDDIGSDLGSANRMISAPTTVLRHKPHRRSGQGVWGTPQRSRKSTEGCRMV